MEPQAEQFYAYNPRVVEPGGIPINSFPYQVQILYGDHFFCAGTVLASYLILTAAHCFSNDKIKHWNLIRVRRAPHTPVVSLAGRPILHDAWRIDKKGMENDIALLELRDELAVYQNVILSQRTIYNSNGDTNNWSLPKVTVGGWGVSRNSTNVGKDFYAGDLTILQKLTCENYWKLTFPERAFCTHEKDADACEGDSGGPVICTVRDLYQNKVKAVLCGLVSFGDSDDRNPKGPNGTTLKPCSHTNITKPGAYTDVTRYTIWILRESCHIRQRKAQPIADTFMCCNKFTIPKKNECDGFPDCFDGSDEFQCTEGSSKECPNYQDSCEVANVTYTIVAPTFVYPNSVYQLHIFLERGPTNSQYNFTSWLRYGHCISNWTTIKDGDSATLLIPIDELSKKDYTLVVQAADPLDSDSAFYLREHIQVGRDGRNLIFTDKDIYEPGDTVNVFAVFLIESNTSSISISIEDSQGNCVWKWTNDQTSLLLPPFMSHQFQIFVPVNPGKWSVRMTYFENRANFPTLTVVKEIEVRKYKEDSVENEFTNQFSSDGGNISNDVESSESHSVLLSPLKINLLETPNNQVVQNAPFKIQVEVDGLLNVAHLIIHSAGEVVFAKSYQPTNPTSFILEVPCPEEIWREAKLIVFGYINETFVSGALDLKVVNWRQKTSENLGLNISANTAEVEQIVAISIKANPGSVVYLRAEDAAFEDPDEFASKKWLNEVLQPEKTSRSSSRRSENIHDMQNLDLKVFNNAREKIRNEGPDSNYGTNQNMRNHQTKMAKSKRRIWISEMINIVNDTTEVEFKTPRIPADWTIKGFVVIEVDEGIRRIELLPTALIKTVRTLKLPPSVIQTEILEVLVFTDTFLQANSTEALTINVKSNGSINFIENGANELTIIQYPGNDTKTIFVKFSFNHFGQLPFSVEVSKNETVLATIEKSLNVKPNGERKSKVAASFFMGLPAAEKSSPIREILTSLGNIPYLLSPKSTSAGIFHGHKTLTLSSNLVAMLADNIDDLASIFPRGSAETNLLLMTANTAILKYLNANNLREDLHWKQSMQNLQSSYQNQLALRRPDGSFAEFSKLPNGSIWLTAWTIRAFVSAEKFICVDKSVLKGGLNFLTNNKTGLFSIETSKLIDDARFLALRAFTLVTLLKAKEYCNCADYIQRLRGDLQQEFMADDASLYGKALVTYAEHLWKEQNPRNDSVSYRTSYLRSTNAQFGNYSAEYKEMSNALKVKFHSYMILIYSHRNVGVKAVFEANKLLEHLTFPFGFVSAHDTAEAILALAEVADKEQNISRAYSLTASAYAANRVSKEILSNQTMQPGFNYNKYNLPIDTKNVRINCIGQTLLLSQFSYDYYVPWNNRSGPFTLNVLPVHGENGTIEISARYNGNRSSKSAVIEVNLPTGFVFNQLKTNAELQNGTNISGFMTHHFLNGNTKLELSFASISNVHNVSLTIFADQDFNVDNSAAALVKMFEISNILDATKTFYQMAGNNY